VSPGDERNDELADLVESDLADDIALFEASPDVLPGVLLGAELARQLNLSVGEEVQLISPDGDIGPTGLRPKLTSMRVAGVFQTGMYEYDQKLAYTALYSAQRFFDLGPDRNALEARFSDPELALSQLEPLSAKVSQFPGLSVSTFRDRNKNLFSALALERIIMLLILGFIVFVASLLIVSSLVMLVVEKVREIAVLKALGASDGSIVRSFVNIGAFIGLFGVLSGVPLGVGTLVALIQQGLTLPREFYITELPVKLDAAEIAIFAVAAFGMCLIATLYPSKKASELTPADGLRHG
jgi:lipoprotein-releasing system permease protein